MSWVNGDASCFWQRRSLTLNPTPDKDVSERIGGKKMWQQLNLTPICPAESVIPPSPSISSIFFSPCGASVFFLLRCDHHTSRPSPCEFSLIAR